MVVVVKNFMEAISTFLYSIHSLEHLRRINNIIGPRPGVHEFKLTWFGSTLPLGANWTRMAIEGEPVGLQLVNQESEPLCESSAAHMDDFGGTEETPLSPNISYSDLQTPKSHK